MDLCLLGLRTIKYCVGLVQDLVLPLGNPHSLHRSRMCIRGQGVLFTDDGITKRNGKSLPGEGQLGAVRRLP